MINKNILSQIPETPGVYIFKNADFILYIGKSKNLRSRIQTHLSSRGTKSAKFTNESTKLEIIETAGEMGAEIREARMIKSLNPIYNRRLRKNRRLIQVNLVPNNNGYLVPTIIDKCVTRFRPEKYSESYIFDSKITFDNLLDRLAGEFGLCPIVMGLEKGDRCFMRMLGKCLGACERLHSVEEFNETILEVFKIYKIHFWKFNKPVRIIEKFGNRQEIFTIDNWMITDYKYKNIKSSITIRKTISFDEFKIIRSYLK